MLWGAVLAITVFRLSVSTSGALNENEALLAVCATHPAGGYIEGPAGVPLLLFLKQCIFGQGVVTLRCISPVALLLLSWSVWWIGRRIAPQRPSIALWSVVTLNLLPLINLASLVMDGAMVTASLVLLSVVAGWHALEAREIKGHENITPWFLFGVILGICTLFYYPICFLLLVVVAIRMISRGANSISWRSVIIAATLLVAGWVLPLIWNARHNWIQWSSVAYGFDAIHCGSVVFSLGLAVAVSAIMVPFLVRLAYAGKWWRGFLLFLGVIMASVSILFLLSPSLIPENLPSPIGVTGIAVLSKSVVALRAELSGAPWSSLCFCGRITQPQQLLCPLALLCGSCVCRRQGSSLYRGKISQSIHGAQCPLHHNRVQEGTSPDHHGSFQCGGVTQGSANHLEWAPHDGENLPV